MKVRLILALAGAALWSVLAVARLHQLQVRQHDEFTAAAKAQQHRVVELEAPRGTLFDARQRKLAMSVQVDSIYADPGDLEDPAAAAARLAGVLGTDRRKLARRLAEDRDFVWVARQLDPATARAVRELGISGVASLKESKRVYPLRHVASQLVGFAGVDHNGLEGLERTYDRVVAGEPVERRVLKDARQATVASPAFSFRDAEPGGNLHLTIDVSLQHVLESELAAAVERRRAKSGTALLLDPWTGAILAMASMPSFDPNRFREFPVEDRRNRAIADAFEPGSTFKIVTAAAALESNLADPSDLFECENGAIRLAGRRIRDHKPFGLLSFREIIAKSSNVGTIKLALLVGKERLYRQILSFGFGRPTGVDLPGESAGILQPVEGWHQLASAYISFGQGVSVTALQMASAVAAVANGGTLYEPYVVAGIDGNEGYRDLHPEPVVAGRPVSAATARTLGRMLEAVVEQGTGRRAAIDGYRVAGKTGTAQKAVPGGGYSPDRYLASFVGFAPARRPAVVGFVAIDEPRDGYHGGDVAAPVFQAIVRRALVYLGVRPGREAPERWPGEPAEPVPAQEAVRIAAATPPVAGVREPAEEGVLPDLSGLTARQAVTRSAALGLEIGLHGNGRVRRQSPPAGTPVEAAERLEVWLATGASR